MPPRTIDSRAFTLFELVLVLLIIGIAAAAIVPVVGSNVRSPRLRAAANVLAADIELCASECIGQPGSPRALVFDTSNNTYKMIDMNAGTPVTHPMDSRPFINDFATGRNAQLAGVAITSLKMGAGTLNSLTFDAYGKPVLTADFIVTMSYNRQSMTVTVKMGTGDVTIADAGVIAGSGATGTTGSGTGGSGTTDTETTDTGLNDNGQNKDNGNGQKNGIDK